MRRLIALAATAALSVSPLLITSAGAEEAPEYNKEGTCGPGTSKVARGVIMIGDGKAGGNTLYIDDRDFAGGNGMWVYKEANKYNFLQRGGKAIEGSAENCTSADGIPEEDRTVDESGNPTWKPDLCLI